jgi:hypothetical protein
MVGNRFSTAFELSTSANAGAREIGEALLERTRKNRNELGDIGNCFLHSRFVELQSLSYVVEMPR